MEHDGVWKLRVSYVYLQAVYFEATYSSFVTSIFKGCLNSLFLV